jgi:hypothetical protein
MSKTRALPRSFTAPDGKTLFVAEGDRIRIFGQNGTEASVPISDLESFQRYLSEQSPAPPFDSDSGLREEDAE